MKLSIIILALLATRLRIVNADFWNRAFYNGNETVDGKHVEVTASLLECGVRCSNQHGCDHFFYKDESHCYLVSPRFLDIGSRLLTGTSKYEYMPTDCPLLFKNINGICFYVVDGPKDKLTSPVSNPFCQMYGAHLMVIDSQAKHDFIINYIIPGNTYLFGIYNILPNESFDTTDGRSSADIPYSNWYDGQPNGPYNEPNYGIIRTYGLGSNFTWTCGGKKIRYFICEKY